MNLNDIILVTENNKGTEINMLMTLEDYKEFISSDDMSDMADQMLLLGRTLGEENSFAEYYRAANVTVFARFCKDEVQLGKFLQGLYNDSRNFRFDREASSQECIDKMKELAMTDRGWVDDLCCIMKVWTGHLKEDRLFTILMTMTIWYLKHYHRGILW